MISISPTPVALAPHCEQLIFVLCRAAATIGLWLQLITSRRRDDPTSGGFESPGASPPLHPKRSLRPAQPPAAKSQISNPKFQMDKASAPPQELSLALPGEKLNPQSPIRNPQSKRSPLSPRCASGRWPVREMPPPRRKNRTFRPASWDDNSWRSGTGNLSSTS